MKKLLTSATVTAILGLVSCIALILLYLALCDIAKMETDLSHEWYIAGISLIIIGAFIISIFFTVGYVLKLPGRKM